MPIEVFIIVIISVVGGLAYAAYEQHVKLQLRTKKTKFDDETQATINELKERIQVLEKIVTDEKYNLKKEINSLDKVG